MTRAMGLRTGLIPPRKTDRSRSRQSPPIPGAVRRDRPPGAEPRSRAEIASCQGRARCRRCRRGARGVDDAGCGGRRRSTRSRCAAIRASASDGSAPRAARRSRWASCRCADDEPDLVAQRREAALDELDRLHDDGRGAVARGAGDAIEDPRPDGRMDDRLEPRERLRVREHDAAEGRPVEGAVGRGDIGAERLEHLRRAPARPARRPRARRGRRPRWLRRGRRARPRRSTCRSRSVRSGR